MRRLLVVLALAGVVLTANLSGVAPVQAATLQVCPSCTPYNTIQKAIDAAHNGDLIVIRPDTYNEHLTIPSTDPASPQATDLTLQAAQVTVDGSGTGPVLRVRFGATVRISGMTLTNGAGSYGGILNGGTLTLSNSTIKDNQAFNGGGIGNSGTLTLSNSTVKDNQAPYGGGIFNTLSGTVTLDHSTVTGNTATSSVGGGILNMLSGTVTLDHSPVTDNQTLSGGGGGIYNGGTLTLSYSTVKDNTAATFGGGIWNAGTVTLDDHSKVIDNHPNNCVNVPNCS